MISVIGRRFIGAHYNDAVAPTLVTSQTGLSAPESTPIEGCRTWCPLPNTRANRILSLASKCSSLAVKWQMRESNPCRGVERNHEERRERYLSPEEMERLIGALNASKNPSRNVVRLALLTGARRGEILSMRWRDLDLAAGTWTKPSHHTKTKKIHRVPLSAPAHQLLAEIRAEAQKDAARLGEWVFPGNPVFFQQGPFARVSFRRLQFIG